jgi:hypothetical protein
VITPPLPTYVVSVAAVFIVAGKVPAQLAIDDPPVELKSLLTRLDDPDAVQRSAAAEKLATLDWAAPYLRHQISGARPFLQRQLTAILTELDHRRHQRNAKRAVEWSKERRADLLTDYASTPADKEDLSGQIDPIIRLMSSATHDYAELTRVMEPPNSLLGVGSFQEWSRRDTTIFSGPKVVIDFWSMSYRLIKTHDLNITMDNLERSGWICVARDRLHDTNPRTTDWWYSIVMVNSQAKFDWVSRSLVICDGDVELPRNPRSGVPGNFSSSILIVNGTIRSKGRAVFGNSYVWASDGMEFTNGVGMTTKSVLASSGTINRGPNPGKPEGKVLEKAKTDPLGFRFFRIEDVGVEAVMRPEGLTVTKVLPNSPFSAHDVREGDVVTKVNDTVVNSAREFRRQVRQSVVAESGVFYLRRGGEDLSRIVYFDGLFEPRK